MSVVAYLANSFPETSEPYVLEEILELRKRGWHVLPCSFRRPPILPDAYAPLNEETVYVFPPRLISALAATWMCVGKFGLITDLVCRIIRGPESFSRRARGLIHTWFGAYLAVLLRREHITHIHVHHGYFSSWSGMVAARFIRAGFSMTLHGSDLLLRADYLDYKLENCQFCVTVSEFNRNYIVDHHPTAHDKVTVHRLGIDLDIWKARAQRKPSPIFSILAVGRLHPVKNHGFLALACHSLKTTGVPFRCFIAGEGEEHGRLGSLIHELELEQEVRLLGNVPRTELSELYAQAEVVVLTSHSEGIPVALMEAMAMERIVLAPAITGIPELIVSGKTGFLYEPGSMEDFLAKLTIIRLGGEWLDDVRAAARRQIEEEFNSQRNLAQFAKDFTERVTGVPSASHDLSREHANENPVLQQI